MKDFFHRHFYNSITNPTRKLTLTKNAARCFLTKLAGGELLKQSVCVLMFPPKNVILQAASPLQLGEGLSLVSVLTREKKGSTFTFKVAHSGFGDEARPGEEKRHPRIQENKSRLLFICPERSIRFVSSALFLTSMGLTAGPLEQL